MPRAKQKLPANPYSVHPAVLMMQKWVSELKGKTGRTLEEWLKLVRKEGPPDEPARRDWLKEKHGLGTNSAWWIAERANGTGAVGIGDEDPDHYLKMAVQYVEDMFSGSKAGLRPIYDELLALGLGIGKDVKACPCRTMVPLFRNHVFAQIKPRTRTTIDFGFALKDTKPTGRLEDTGGFKKKDRITHRIQISSVKDIDAEVKKWLKAAYDMDA